MDQQNSKLALSMSLKVSMVHFYKLVLVWHVKHDLISFYHSDQYYHQWSIKNWTSQY